jgi:hypothetical protein
MTLLWLRRSRFPRFWSPMPRSVRELAGLSRDPVPVTAESSREIGTPSGPRAAVSEIGPH